ncbi:MAG: 3-deoxy-manno-octulosonate cytidylyltransferase [Calditrichales bacterium]|nr:MAG: 3-deoxy-manno-octulosonate cytidylyltransferase [Calditrichales bacterium]
MAYKPKVIGVIPARYGSSRFPGKIIAPLAGKPMIQHVYQQAVQSKMIQDLYVAVDDERVFDVVTLFGGKAIMTDPEHASGTDRIAEVIADMDADIIVNIQGDQPLLDPKMIDEAVAPMLRNPAMRMATLKTRIDESAFDDPGVVKVVTDLDGYALYFSRSLIPMSRDKYEVPVYEHVGLYVYRRDFLLELARLPETPLGKAEMLEQLKVLENGYRIFVTETQCDPIAGMSVDTPEDLARIENILSVQMI